MADIFAILVAGCTHVGLSKVRPLALLLPPTTRLTRASSYRTQLFPNRDSLIAEAVLAEDVLEGRVPGYEHLARREFRPQEGSITPSDEKLEGDAMVGSV
jgi:NCS1 family nucleobase:cation symporter-1